MNYTETETFPYYSSPSVTSVSNLGYNQIGDLDDYEEVVGEVPFHNSGIEELREEIITLQEQKAELIEELELLAAGTPLALKYFFDELTPGLRIVYTPPVDNSQYAKENPNSGWGDLLEQEISASSNTMKGYIDKLEENNSEIFDYIKGDLKDRKKAFYFKEEIKRQKALLPAEAADTDDLIILEGDTKTREVYPISLIDSTGISLFEEACLESSEVGPAWWFDKKDINMFQLGGTGDDNFYEEEYERSISNMQKRLSNSKEFKLLFDFIFPIDRYLSMLNVYSILVSSSLDGMEASMSGVREKLFKLFDMLSSSGDYQGPSVPLYNVDDAIGGDSKCFKLDDEPISLEELLTGNFGINLNMPKNPLALMDYGAVAKAGKDNIKALFKALVEFQDPNIKAAKKIRTLLQNLGMCPVPPLFLISLGLLPPTVFGYPPLGIGIGPPLTPIGMAYLAFGFEMETLYKHFYTEKAINAQSARVVDCEAVQDTTCGTPLFPTDE